MMSTKSPEEQLLLSDIASLAALINKHKSAQTPFVPTANRTFSKHPPPVSQKKFSNLTLKSQSAHTISPSITNNSTNNNITTPIITHQQPPQQQLIHKNPYKLVKPKPIPNIPPSTLPTTKPPTPNSYVRRGNKLVRKSILKITSQHKKFILKSPSTNKSVSSSTSLRVKQQLLAQAAHNAGFYRRQLSYVNPSLASKGVSRLTSYFRRGNSLVRKDAHKYIRPGAVILPKKTLGTPPPSAPCFA